jgi:hypothetical protein
VSRFFRSSANNRHPRWRLGPGLVPAKKLCPRLSRQGFTISLPVGNWIISTRSRDRPLRARSCRSQCWSRLGPRTDTFSATVISGDIRTPARNVILSQSPQPSMRARWTRCWWRAPSGQLCRPVTRNRRVPRRQFYRPIGELRSRRQSTGR